MEQVKTEVHRHIVGQHEVVEQILIALLAGGHALLEGVPGLAKTLMVRSLAAAIDLSFKRIQFTPDLMPSDIVGTEILQQNPSTKQTSFQFVKGAIFAHLVLADEINRTPPKTQAALLEAMQERSVTYSGKTYDLPPPFFILATQNPIEQSGTYPLPEAQLDRFLLYIKVNYPTENEELAILSQTTSTQKKAHQAVVSGTEIVALQAYVRQVSIAPELLQYINQLVRNSRPQQSKISEIKEYVAWGAGTRAGQALVLTAKARALLKGRYAVVLDDIQSMAFSVLRHRLVLNFRAEAENIDKENLIQLLLGKTKIGKKTL
ncbi:MAG: AAA family ATPase [Chitinophagales bacterium]